MINKDVLPLNTMAKQKNEANQVDTDKMVDEILKSLQEREKYNKEHIRGLIVAAIALYFIILLITINIHKPTIPINNVIVDQLQKQQQQQISILNKRVDSLTNVIVIKKKEDAKLESDSRKQISEIRQQIITFKTKADAQKHTIDTADIDQNFDILTAKIKARQR